MFDKLLGMIGKTLGAANSQDIPLLKSSFEGLALVDKAFPERAYRFVLRGDDPALLAELMRAPSNTSELLGKPGYIGWNNWIPDDARRQIAEKSRLARVALYAKQSCSGEQLLRLAKVFAALDQGRALPSPISGLPLWVQYLVNDVLHGTRENEADPRGWMNVNLLHDLLQLDGHPGTLALLPVFERKDISEYSWSNFEPLLAGETLDPYLLQHADAVPALPAKLSVSGRLNLSRVLGRPALAATFAPVQVALAVDSGKTVRGEAARHLEAIPLDQRLAMLERILRDGSTAEREQAAALIAALPDEQGKKVLEAALADERGKTVQQTIRSAISRMDAAADAQGVELPPAPEYKTLEETRLPPTAVQRLQAMRQKKLEEFRLEAEREIQDNKESKRTWKWRQENYRTYRKLTDDDLAKAVEILDGTRRGELSWEQHSTIEWADLFSLPEFSLFHFLRWYGVSRIESRGFWNETHFKQWLAHQDLTELDLRALGAALERCGVAIDAVAVQCLCETWGDAPQDLLPPERIWPFFADNPRFIDESLGLRPSPKERPYAFSLGPTLETLSTFPTIPAKWVPRLLEIALGDGKTHRAAAQQVLAKVPDIGVRAIEALASSKQEIRILAAEWLADLGEGTAVPALYRALEKESRETVRAALMTALERLGEDIRPLIAPDILLREANKGLKGKLPAGLAWFPFVALPACRWAADDGEIEPEIIRWWVVLAYKLKEPGGNALLERYLGLLAAPSRAALGSFILRQFILQDTKNPSLDEAISHAQANAAQRYQMYQSWVKWDASYGDITQEQIFEMLKREKLAEYLGSAIGEKGILALISGGVGHELVSMLQVYMRDHYLRRSQIEAILEALSNSNDPAVIQLLLAVSRRHRTASVQAKARELVERVAVRNGWSPDQLADRTIPSAGFDESGRLEIQYGERPFVVVLDDAMKPVLRTAEGKEIKALPEPRKSDDPESIKEAKQLFSSCKKELKQVLDLQTARLYESMCAGRVWPAAEWREYLHAHPIVGRLIQQLLWQAVDADGQGLQLFRPTEDGSLIDADDEEIDIASIQHVRLAHAALLPPEDVRVWTRHLKDYKIKPLFAQLSHLLPALDPGGAELTTIDDRQGWMSDTFTVRGAFTKLGYRRAEAEDGGFFTSYFKDFTGLGIRVQVEFSGNTLPEENVVAALHALSFERLSERNYRLRAMPLGTVPPVLLAEAYADYHTVAKACSGFDPEWQKKVPW